MVEVDTIFNPVFKTVLVGRVSNCALREVRLTRTLWLAGTFTTIGLPPLNAALAGCDTVTVAAVPVEDNMRYSGSPPGELCRSVMSGGANQNSVPVCA